MAREPDGHQRVTATPDEEGLRLEPAQPDPETVLAVRRLEVDLARSGIERRAPGRGEIGAQKLVDTRSRPAFTRARDDTCKIACTTARGASWTSPSSGRTSRNAAPIGLSESPNPGRSAAMTRLRAAGTHRSQSVSCGDLRASNAASANVSADPDVGAQRPRCRCLRWACTTRSIVSRRCSRCVASSRAIRARRSFRFRKSPKGSSGSLACVSAVPVSV